MRRSNLILLLLAGVPCLPATASPAPTTTTGIQHFADAHGSAAKVAGTVRSGKSFPVSLGTCGTFSPASKSNTGATVDVPGLLHTGAIDNAASATDDSRSQTSRASATVHAVNLLSGLITAQELRSVSITSIDASGFHTNGDQSRFTNLVVAGTPILLMVAPNTRIPLPGIGFVVLNEQVANVGPTSASLAVNMIHVVVTLANPLVPAGTNIVVGHARSALVQTDVVGVLDGFAYGTTARVGSTLTSGMSALVMQGCRGTNGAVETNSIASADLLNQFATNLVSCTASGVVNGTSARGETTATVAALSLLSSLVTADTVKADAHSFTDGNVFTFTDTGSSFVNLSVSGFPGIGDDVAPNTRLNLAGLGTLWLKREIFTPNSIEVRMIELIVKQENVHGLPIGTNIRVAVAHSSAH